MSFKTPTSLRMRPTSLVLLQVGGVNLRFGTPRSEAATRHSTSTLFGLQISVSRGAKQSRLRSYASSPKLFGSDVVSWSASAVFRHWLGSAPSGLASKPHLSRFSSITTRKMSNFFHETNGLAVTEQDLQDTCFQYYDKDEDGGLNLKEFGSLCRDLLSDSAGKPYTLQIRMQADMFYVFDQNKDGKVDETEFGFMWKRWVKPVLYPTTALLVVDVQNDFISGSLAIHRCPAGHKGEEVVPVINKMLNSISFNEVIYTLDWHPEDHISFISNVHQRPFHPTFNMTPDEVQVYDTVIFDGPSKIEQKMWPVHCIQGSWGAELHPDLKVVDNAIFVHKGTNSDIDSYSAFWDNEKRSETSLNFELASRNVTDVFICGLAYDICVAYTARHALEKGYRTYLVDDASRGVSNEDIADMIKQLIAKGAILVQSDEVKDIVEGKDRRLEMGYRSAMMLASALQKKGADHD